MERITIYHYRSAHIIIAPKMIFYCIRYGSLGDSPIHYLFQSVDAAELTVLYSIADAALITSVR